MAKRGINLVQFITDKVYSFFANQLYKIEAHQYAGQEYKHQGGGILQYYQEELGIEKPETVVRLIEILLCGLTFTRNEHCPCGSSKKFKYCHMEALNTMELLGFEKLTKDRENILTYVDKAK